MSKYKPQIIILVICLLLNLEFWILGPFSFVQKADNADVMMSYYMRLVHDFFEYGPTYWADYMSIGVDRLSNTLSLLRFPALLLMVFPDWVAYQLLVILQVFVPALFLFKISHEHLLFSKQSSLIGALSYAFLISVGQHNFHFGYEFGVLLFPAVVFYLNMLLSTDGIKKYILVFVMGALYSVVFSPIAKNLPFVVPFIFLWFLLYKRNKKYPLLFLSLFFVGALFSQTQEIITLIIHKSGSQREFLPDRYQLKAFVDVLSIFKLELLICLFIALLTKFKNTTINYFIVLLPLLIFSFYYLSHVVHYIIPSLKSFSFKRFGLMIPFNVAFLITLFVHYYGFKLSEYINWKRLKSYGLVVIALTACIGLVDIKINVLKNWLMLNTYNSFYDWEQIQRISDHQNETDELYRVETYAQSHITSAMLATYGLSPAGGYMSMFPQYLFEFWESILKKGLMTGKLYDEFFLKTHLYLYLWPVTIQMNDDYFDFSVTANKYYNLNLLSLLNVKYISSRVPLYDKNLELIEEGKIEYEPGMRMIEKYGRSAVLRKEFIEFLWQRIKFNFTTVGDQYLYRNTKYFPRFFLTKQIKKYNDSITLLQALESATEKGLREFAFIEIDEINEGLKIENHYMHGEVKIIKYSPDNIIVEVVTDGDAILVASNTYSRYWHAKIDGKSTQIFKADHTLWGVKIAKGRSVIEYNYIPPYSLGYLLKKDKRD
jgi:hypothetical protein